MLRPADLEIIFYFQSNLVQSAIFGTNVSVRCVNSNESNFFTFTVTFYLIRTYAQEKKTKNFFQTLLHLCSCKHVSFFFA